MHTMTTLYRVPLSLPLYPCQKTQKVILCSASSAAMSGSPEPWKTLISQQDSSDTPRMQAKKRIRKRLQIAGVDQEELVDPWLLMDADSRFAELHGVQIHYKTAYPIDRDTEEEVKRDDVSKRDDVLGSAPALTGPPQFTASSSATLLSLSSSSSSSELASSSPSLSSSRPLTSSSMLQPRQPMSSSSSSPALPTSSSSPLPPSSSIPAILLHGFGASLFSWERVLRPLAQVLNSQVVAFDRPAFGLTSRIKVPLAHSAISNGGLAPVPLNPYSVGFSSAATIAFIDFLKSDKAVLIGHSAGCIVAADAYFEAPERIAAIIMVAPALVAPVLLYKKAQTMHEQSLLLQVWSNIWAKVVWAFSSIGEIFQLIASSIRLLWCRLLAAILRSDFGFWLIRTVMDKLSLQAVRLAWYDKEKVDDYVIAGYTKPLKCRDWEHALLEYVIALVGNPFSNDSQKPSSKRLEEIQCPVLVITGDSDAIVPAWNAERLSKVLPNAQYHVIKNCGHLPHEEKPDEFLSAIQRFMKWVQHGATAEITPNESMNFMPA